MVSAGYTIDQDGVVRKKDNVILDEKEKAAIKEDVRKSIDAMELTWFTGGNEADQKTARTSVCAAILKAMDFTVPVEKKTIKYTIFTAITASSDIKEKEKVKSEIHIAIY